MLDMLMKGFWQSIMEYVVKIAMAAALVMWTCALTLTFCFTSNYFITNFDQSNLVTKTSINLIRSFRHNCRIVWGTILALDPKMYPGISDTEILMLPQPKHALYQFNSFWGPTQKRGLILLSMHALDLERNALGLVLASKDIYANTLISDIKWHHDLERKPAQE